MNSILYLRQIKEQLKNIDNLPDSISGIKNVLSTITNKTDVVRGGVDTTLSKVNSLESSVNSLKQDLTKVQNVVGKNVPINDLKVKLIGAYNGGNSAFVQVDGKGKLYLATLFFTYHDYESAADVYIDGTKTFSFKGQGGDRMSTRYGGFYSAPIFKGSAIISDSANNIDPTWTMTTTAGSFVVTEYEAMNECEFVYYEGNPYLKGDKIIMSEYPITFNKSLKVQVTKGSNFGIAVAYTLG